MVDALAELRHASLQRSPAYPGGPAALRFHTERLEELIDAGTLEVLGDPDAPTAYCLAATRLHERIGEPTTTIVVHRDDSAASAVWCEDAVARVLPEAAPAIELLVPAWDRVLVNRLGGLGLGIQHVNLAGRVDLALDRIGPECALPDGFSLERFHVDRADDAVELFGRVFGAEPQWFWFGGHPKFLEHLRNRLTTDSASERLLVRLYGRIVGYADAEFHDDDPHHGRSAGLDLVLLPEARGRGLARHLYRRLLHAMDAHGTTWFKGSTAQKPVLHLGRELGRAVTGYELARGETFPRDWFDVP